MEKIEWDKLEKTKVERVFSTKFIEKILQEGIYVCPQCHGEGKVMTIHRFSPPHEYGTCGMCRGTGEIKKCPVCNTNPVSNKGQDKCINCQEMYSKQLRDVFEQKCKDKGEIK